MTTTYTDAQIEDQCTRLKQLEQMGDSFRVVHSEFRSLHDMLRSLLTERQAAPVSEVTDAEALAHFTEYFVRNYPGPNTIISDPNWHAPKIFRAAQYALTHFAAIAQEKQHG